MIADWLISAGWGILFGLIPSHIWIVANVEYAMFAQNRNIPEKLTKYFSFRSDLTENKWGKKKKLQVFASRVFSIAIIVIILVRYQYVTITGFLNGRAAINDLIVLETGFTPFLLLTWLLPAYLLERYLQHHTKEQKEVK